MAVSRIVSDVFASDAPLEDFPNPGHTLLPIFPSFRSMGMVGEACLPSNAYYPRTPDYTLYSGVHVCWSEHSDSSFIYGLMSLDYGLGTMTATTFIHFFPLYFLFCELLNISRFISFGIIGPIVIYLKMEFKETLAQQFNFTYRYMDDVLSLKNNNFWRVFRIHLST